MAEEESHSSPPPQEEEAAAPAAAPKEEKKKESCSTSCGDSPFAPLAANPICQEIHEILLWKKIITSLAAFCAVNFAFLLVLYFGYSSLTISSLILLVLLVAAFAAGQGPVLLGKHVLKKDMPSFLEGKTISIPKEQISQLATALGDLVNALLGALTNVLLSKELPVTIGAFFGFIFTAWLGTKARITAVIYVAVLFGFIWPRLYQEQKEPIDKLWATIKEQAKAQCDKVEAMAKEKLQAKPKDA